LNTTRILWNLVSRGEYWWLCLTSWLKYIDVDFNLTRQYNWQYWFRCPPVGSQMSVNSSNKLLLLLILWRSVSAFAPVRARFTVRIRRVLDGYRCKRNSPYADVADVMLPVWTGLTVGGGRARSDALPFTTCSRLIGRRVRCATSARHVRPL